MLFGSHDDDENVFSISSSGGSKLANLFSTDDAKGDDNKHSLTYTAPKQPKKPESGAPSSSSVAVLHAVAVHTFKLENQQYQAQGKLGAAILGNHESFTYQLLLYKGQQQHVALANITPSFAYNVQPNFYANFYDNKRDCWSVRFDTEQASVDFARQVVLAKANSSGSSGLATVLAQDMVPGQDEPLDTGHSAEVKYTGWLMSGNTLGQMFDSNASSQTGKKFKLGKGKVIKGWEEGLIGAKKGGRRLLVIPPALAYGTQGAPPKIPPNATLIFDVHIVRTNQSRESRSSTPVASHSSAEEIKPAKMAATPEMLVTAAQPIKQPLQDESVKARGASISEQLSHSPKSEKALLISRMAKMGTPMLPMQLAAHSSDSENEDEAMSRGQSVDSPLQNSSPKKPRPAPAVPVAHPERTVLHPHLAPTMEQHQVALLHHQQQQHQHQMALGMMEQAFSNPYLSHAPSAAPQLFGTQGFAAPAGPPIVVPPSVASDSSHLPLLIAESRTQNSEMRMTLSKISDRVDMVLSKIGDMRSHGTEHTPYMESNMLLQNIQRIVQENAKLKVEADERNTKILTLNDKISDLLQRNQKLMEDSNQWLEKRSDTFHQSSSQSQARVLSLEEEKSKLSYELSEALSKLATLQLQLQRRQAEHFSKGDEHLNSQIEEQDAVIADLQRNIRSLKTEKKDLHLKLESLQDQLQDLQSSKDSLEKNVERVQKRVSEERRRAQEELEEVRNQNKDEVDTLRKKLAKQASSLPDQSEHDVLEQQWQEEKERLLKELQELKRSFRDTTAAKEDLVQQVAELQKKVDATKKEKAESDVSDLKDQIAVLSSWKTKYEDLSSSVSAMKQSYEERLHETDPGQSSSAVDSSLLEAKLKKAMNALYRGLQREFLPSESYSGNESLKMILNMIKVVTTAVLEELSAENAASVSSPTVAPHAETISKPQPVPENTPAASQIETVPPQSPVSPADMQHQQLQQVQHEEEKEQKRVENELHRSTNEEPVQQEGIPIPKASSLGTNEVASTEVNPSPKSEDSDDFHFSAKHALLSSPDSTDMSNKKYVFFDKKSKSWKPQPPPPPLFDDDDEEDEDDWLK